MAKKSKSKSRAKSTSRALNALEIAEKEMQGSASDSDGGRYDPRSNGTVVNLLKKSKKGRNSNDSDSELESEGSFEDEDLDSDEAFGSGDDIDVMNSKLSQTLRDKESMGTLKTSDVIDVDNLSDGGYTSIEEEELMPLSQIWDMGAKSSKTVNDNSDDGMGEEMKFQDSDDASSESESSAASGSEEESESDSENENPFDEISEDEEDVELKTITSKLLRDTTKHSSKRLDTYGTGEENEYILPSVAKNTGIQKLSLEDMMNVVDDKAVTEKATLLKGDTNATAIPLPQRIQQRNERQAAYEISKDEVNKWSDVVKQNRRAEHLSFPLNPQVEHNEETVFTNATNKNTQSELQEKVNEVLEQSNMVDPEKESTFEDLNTAQMTPEEMKKRTVEMRLMRELMFREDRKSRRIKKIKSKAYHRIKKKEMQRNRELAGVSDESDTDLDIARAKERMTLKHKTNSKWAKDMIKHGMTNDAETREEMEEMLRQGERLKAKIQDRDSDEEDNRKTLSDVEKDELDEDEGFKLKENLGKTGVMNMAFMRNAEAREKEANREQAAKLRALENGEDLFDSENDADDREENVQLNKGRRIYTPSNLEAKKQTDEANEYLREEKEMDDSRNLVNRLKGSNKRLSAVSQEASNASEVVQEDKEPENPWLAGSDDESNIKRSTKISVVDKDSSKEAKSLQKLEKKRAKQDRSSKNGKGNEDSELLLEEDTSSKLNINDPYAGSDDDTGNEFIFKQQDVIAEAFAGDDVVAEFATEKKRIVDDDDDKEVDVTLPGWGDWAGEGAQPRKKRKFIKKVKGVVRQDKRKDKHLQNVIINEKINKKNLKYQSSAVPFPFENREQYERSLRMPLGQQWTSRKSHQKLIKPRIMTKPGEVIDPLKAPFK